VLTLPRCVLTLPRCVLTLPRCVLTLQAAGRLLGPIVDAVVDPLVVMCAKSADALKVRHPASSQRHPASSQRHPAST
jgi:hypothetical protein